MKETCIVIVGSLALIFLLVSLTLDILDLTVKARATIRTTVNKHTVPCINDGYVTYSAVRRFSAVKPY